MATAKKPSATLPAKRVTVIVPGSVHKKFTANLKKAGSNLQTRINELIKADLAV